MPIYRLPIVTLSYISVEHLSSSYILSIVNYRRSKLHLLLSIIILCYIYPVSSSTMLHLSLSNVFLSCYIYRCRHLCYIRWSIIVVHVYLQSIVIGHNLWLKSDRPWVSAKQASPQERIMARERIMGISQTSTKGAVHCWRFRIVYLGKDSRP